LSFENCFALTARPRLSVLGGMQPTPSENTKVEFQKAYGLLGDKVNPKEIPEK
jgi:hypothetical protein